jgi:DNA recombination protein RmuC
MEQEKGIINKSFLESEAKIKDFEQKLVDIQIERNNFKDELTNEKALHSSLKLRFEEEKEQSAVLNEKFTKEFEIVANKVLDAKSRSFTNINKESLEQILKPLSDNLGEFKKKVEDVYDKESKERFSLGKSVEQLVEMNDRLQKEAHNLTVALKTDPKAQGNWGEMILERILEQSGLQEGREYFLENYLKDENGNYLISSEGKKMRPDAIIQYPDNRKVIVDAKVSINAYIRSVEAETSEEQNAHLRQHVQDIKNHIINLSNKGYDDFEKALDFVMMFVPSEPAFMIALKEDPNLWHFAYQKRILLISPTNLVASLKLIEDLWKREHQNNNAKEIADRGSKLYEKFVNFTDNFKKIGKSLESAQNSYDYAFKQLSSGSDNLIRQTEKMRELGIKSSKKIDGSFLEGNDDLTVS